jgi:hypothetical protein
VKTRPRQSGFVLVLILLVLAICGTIMAASARRCGQLGLQASRQVRDLQFRWGASSCQATLLQAAERIFEDRRKSGKAIGAEISASLTLGKMRFQLILSDESAKANVNLLAAQYGGNSAGLIASIGRLQADGPDILPTELRPTRNVDPNEIDMPVRYENFDQVFAINGAAELAGAGKRQGDTARSRITFWADGRINTNRAELPVMREVLAGLVTDLQLNEWDKMRRSEKGFSMITGFGQLQLTNDQAAAVAARITDLSVCYGLWVVANDGTRDWRRFYVELIDPSAASPPRWSFAW